MAQTQAPPTAGWQLESNAEGQLPPAQRLMVHRTWNDEWLGSMSYYTRNSLKLVETSESNHQGD